MPAHEGGVATIYDVAKRAGVSIGTVSRVLNAHHAVAPSTRQAVLSAIDELDYRPNALARGLLSARTHSLGMLVPDLGNPMVVRMIQGVESAALEHGYTLLLGDAHDDETVQARHLRELLERRVDGLLCFPVGGGRAVREAVQRAGVPTMMLSRSAPDPLLPCVVVDERPALAAAVHDLLSLGHRRIAIVAKPQPYGGGVLRSGMLRELLETAGLELRPDYLRWARNGDACRATMHELLALAEPPTALIAGLHEFTAPCLEVLRLTGNRVPDDVSFVTYGDSDWALAFPAPLNVVSTDAIASCAAATRLLIRHVQGDETAPRVLMTASQYIRRGSCGPASDRR